MTPHVQAALFELPESVEQRSLSEVSREWREFRRVSEAEGGLTTATLAAVALGVSRQRVYDLVALRKLSEWEFFGRKLFSCLEVETMMRAKRGPGTRYERAEK
jgi:hypothetical protein